GCRGAYPRIDLARRRPPLPVLASLRDQLRRSGPSGHLRVRAPLGAADGRLHAGRGYARLARADDGALAARPGLEATYREGVPRARARAPALDDPRARARGDARCADCAGGRTRARARPL